MPPKKKKGAGKRQKTSSSDTDKRHEQTADSDPPAADDKKQERPLIRASVSVQYSDDAINWAERTDEAAMRKKRSHAKLAERKLKTFDLLGTLPAEDKINVRQTKVRTVHAREGVMALLFFPVQEIADRCWGILATAFRAEDMTQVTCTNQTSLTITRVYLFLHVLSVLRRKRWRS